jgi:hypothetical protein
MDIRPKLLGSGRGSNPSPLGLIALLGPKHLGQASSPNFNKFEEKYYYYQRKIISFINLKGLKTIKT